MQQPLPPRLHEAKPPASTLSAPFKTKTSTLGAYQQALALFWSRCDPEDEIPALRELCRTDLYFLLRHGLNRQDFAHEWLLERCREVEASPNGYLDLWSREHYKSAIITFGLTIQNILQTHGNGAKGRECCVGIFSHSRGIAKRFLRQIKSEFESNGKLLEWFPDILYSNPQRESAKWSEDDGIVCRRSSNPAEATVEAWGVVDGQPIGKHFTHLVYDDVVVQESTTTPDMLAKTSEMLSLSYALGSEGGVRRMIGTRYHANDAYKTVIERGTATARIHILTADGTADGEPVLRSRAWIDERRRDMGPYIFACQMLQNPLSDEIQGFKADWIQYHDGVSRDGLNVYMVFDPAGGKGKRSDYTAGWVLGLGPDRNIYVLDMVRDRLNLSERAALVMRWHRAYKPMLDGVRYEKYGLQSDIEHIKDVQRRENYRFDITEVGGQTSKIDRIKRLIPYFEQRRVYLPGTMHYTAYDGRTSDLVRDFVEQEYKCFPVPVHDDMLDAMARLIEPDHPLVWPDERLQALPKIDRRFVV